MEMVRKRLPSPTVEERPPVPGGVAAEAPPQTVMSNNIAGTAGGSEPAFCLLCRRPSTSEPVSSRAIPCPLDSIAPGIAVAVFGPTLRCLHT